MQINLHEGQSEVFEDLFVDRTNRFSVVRCSRGWGKSYLGGATAATAVFELMELDASVPNKNVYIVAPTHDQVTDIYFPLLNYDMGMEQYAIRSYREQGRFKFPRNVEMRLLSYEAAERMRGKGAYFVLWDEVSSCVRGIDPREAWEDVIQPAIITRWSPSRATLYGARSPGRALIIGTPKGYNYFHTLSVKEELDNRWKSYHYDYKQSPFLDIEEIERLRDTLDPVTFASEYLASFEESGNNLFYCFNRKVHVRNDLPYYLPPEGGMPGEDIYACIDFNVGIMATSTFALRGRQMHFLDEFQGHPDTESLAIMLKNKYKGHKIKAFPDPTGRARKSSAAVGKTDFTILESHGIECLARSKSPALIDSVAAVNKKLMTASGYVDMYFSPKCPRLIASMERTKWVERNMDTATIDKTENIEHYSDGVRYATEYLFPIESSVSRIKRGFRF